MRTLLICGLAAAALAPLECTTLQQLSLDEMIHKSTAIVRGKVQQSYSAPRGGTIYTHYVVRVTEQWKGTPAAQIDFAVPGGQSGGLQQTFAGAPALTNGQEYVLFLWTSRTALTQVIGMSQGLLAVGSGSGDPMVTRPTITAPIVDSTGQTASDSGIQMRLSELRNRVQSTLSGRTGQQ